VDAFTSKEIRNEAQSLEMLGDLYIRDNQDRQAIQMLKEALAAYNAIHYRKVQGVYVLLGEAFNDQMNLVKHCLII
jgi:predicted Zn-dependent protease